MNIYLPIAEVSLNVFLILSLGASVGMLSGIFGVGGGFLITPLLIFIGVPPIVAVGTGANQIIASSVSGVFTHLRRGTVDIKMGVILTLGGITGSSLGVGIFSWLQSLGQIELIIQLSYVVFLGGIGSFMLAESINEILRKRNPARRMRSKKKRHNFLHGLPFRTRFPKSKLYISALLPLIIGVLVGILSAIMGVGGGFIMVPAMVYLLGMPTLVVVGTSLFQIILVTANTTFLQSYLNQSVDIVLAFLLIIGGVIGAQFGTTIGAKLPGEQIRGLLALLVLGVSAKVFFDLTLTPNDFYEIEILHMKMS